GNITLDISTNRQDVSAITLLPAFTTPANQFTNIGPFDNGNSGNQIDETIEGWRTRTSNSGVTRPGSSSSVSGFSWPTIFPLSIFATTITTPISDSIEDDFPRPSPPEIADNFTFQQFGPDVTTPNGTFQVLATIVTVSMPIATTFPETNQLSNFSPDNNVNTRRSRETNHKGSLLELHLQLNDTVKIRDKRFLKNLEDSLSSIAQSILYPNESEVFTRKKRNLDEVKIKIDKTETLKDHPNDVSILFYVDQPNDFDENPMLAIKLNDVGVANLSEKLGYPVVSEIVVREPSASTLAIIAIATSGVLCFFLILFMGWQCKIREKVRLLFTIGSFGK
uniref:Uncharacterized protein n=1 Tax=Acrobeloides nanus TaxID=290746 RepID=A0A914DCQ4_9BILA